MTFVPARRALRPIGRWTFDFGLWTVLLVAAGVRLAFALRPPPFLTPDSQGYYLPGWELANGLGFGPELRRTPGYPLFVALIVWLFGEDLRALVLAQHALGVFTAGLAHALGREAFGRLAGVAAGLLVALAGPLLIYEHYVLTESLFACLLTLALLLALRAVRLPARGRLFAAGLALAAAALTRPVADVLIPLVPLGLLVQGPGSRVQSPKSKGRGPRSKVGVAPLHFGPWTLDLGLAARRSAWFALGLAALMLPWMLRNMLAHGTFSAEGALGQALIGRTVRHDSYERFYTCPPPGDPASLKIGALRIICEEIERAGEEKPSGGEITLRVRKELELTQAQTSNVLRQVAFDGIASNPGYYLQGTLDKAATILVGKRETVLAAWRERTTRNWDLKWDSRLTPLVDNPPPAEGPEYERADAAVSFFQPWRHRRELGLLLALGLLAALVRPAWRLALLPAAAAGLIVLASAALDGDVWRYRYPVDPLLAVLVGGGLQAASTAVASALARRSAVGGLRDDPSPPPAGPDATAETPEGAARHEPSLVSGPAR